MEYSNFRFVKPLAFERRSTSGALTKYIVYPGPGGNRTGIIMTLDVPFEDVPRYMRNDWQVTSCDSEEEFVSRFGKQLFELIVAEYDKKDKEEAAVRDFVVNISTAHHNVPAGVLSEAKESALDSPEEIWKAKFAFVQNLHRLNNIKDHIYGVERPEVAITHYKAQIEEEFKTFLTVNGKYALDIFCAVDAIYKDNAGFQNILVYFEAQGKQHNRAHTTDEVRAFNDTLKLFLDRVLFVERQESVATISALAVSHSMLHEAIRIFKLFEQE